MAFIIDVSARRIVGRRVSKTRHSDFVLAALEHRAAGRSRYRALGGKPRRQLRAGRDDQRALQGRVDPPARAVEDARGGGDRHVELRVLVQPSSIDAGTGLHPTCRSRGKLIPATHRATGIGELTTCPNQPPRIPREVQSAFQGQGDCFFNDSLSYRSLML